MTLCLFSHPNSETIVVCVNKSWVVVVLFVICLFCCCWFLFLACLHFALKKTRNIG